MLEESVSLWASLNSWFTPSVLFVLLNVMIGTIAFTSSFANHKHRQTNHDDPHHLQQPGLARSPSVLQRIRSINLYSYRSPEPSPPIAAHFTPLPDSSTHYSPQQTPQPHTPESLTQQIFRSPSILQRLRSINLYNFRSQEPHQSPPSAAHFNPVQDSDAHYPHQQAYGAPTQQDFQQTRFGDDQEEVDEKEEPRSLDDVYSQLKGHHVDRTRSDTKPASGVLPGRLTARMRKSTSVKSAFGHFEEDDVVEARRPETMKERKVVAAEVDDEVDAKADDFINRFKHQLKLQRLDSILRYKEIIGRGVGK